MTLKLNTYQISIEGMSCASCAARIEKELSNDKHNENVNVNFSTKSVTLTSTLPLEKIKSTIGGLGYKAQEKTDEKQRLDLEKMAITTARHNMIFAATLTLPVVVLGMIFPDYPGSGLIQCVLALLTLIGPGRGFFVRALKQLSHRQSSMDTLVSMGTGTAFIFSVYLLAKGHNHLYFESTTVIIAFILIGKFLEEHARQSIAKAVRELMKYQPNDAIVVKLPGESSDNERRIPIEKVPLGAMVLVRPGDRFPVDGIVLRGTSSVDAAMLTGESMPIDITIDDRVAAGTMNLTGPLVVEATATGEQTELAHIVAMVEAAQGTKAPIQKLADQVSGWFVPASICIATITLVAWILQGFSLEEGLTAAVAVLVVACPCALGLATPVALMAGTAYAARRGILVKDAASLQLLHKATTIVFDKTGTLTTGHPEVTELYLFEDEKHRATLIAWAAALEAGSNHPLGQAITRFARTHGIMPQDYPSLKEIRETPGVGINAQLAETSDPTSLMIGKLSAMTNMEGNSSVDDLLQKEQNEGQTYVGLAKNSSIIAVFKLRDILRNGAKSSIKTLIGLSITPILATGDGEGAALNIAKELGGIETHFGLTPAQKSILIENLKSTGKIVAMAGDGINDAPALAVADVGLAMGSGADAAMAVAGITLKDSSIEKIVQAITLSRLTFRNIKQNLFWAFAYNILLIPTAAFGHLSPMLAGGAMALSSLFVVGNALRLKSQI